MKWTNRPVPGILLALSLTWNAGEATHSSYLASELVAAAHTAKQQCVNNCRARYRECRRLNQISRFECRGVYQDCARYVCTGLGPG